jgi:quinoprotein dehydrogenase-associated probable ABC transporter substrate-binding protein
MCFRCLSALLLFWLSSDAASARVLRVCADPNNLPFSNKAQEGVENRLAELVAGDLKADLKYTWWVERKGFLENSLDANLCDVVMGVPSTIDSVLRTQPYYRSTYVFLARRDRGLNISSLTDPRLEQMRIGMHVVGEDYAPPAHFLARLGVTSQIVGYSLYGAAGEADPPARLIDAVVRGDVDLAIIWGPFAGYFSKRQPVPLAITPVSPDRFLEIPFTYGISAAVRKDNRPLQAEVQASLTRHCRAISALLVKYGIPQVWEDQPRCDSWQPAAVSSH